MIKIPNEVIFAVLRIIKQANPGDQYFEAYQGHLAKRKENFFDLYHFNWSWAIEHRPASILEVGTRTGISLCQLLCGYIDHSMIDRIVCCDLFNDGYIGPGLVKRNLKLVGIPQALIDKVEFMVGDSKSTVPTINEKFDYILIDGDHSKEGARTDLNNVKDKVNQGGVIVFDDISPDGMDLLDIWHEFKMKNEPEFHWHEDMNGKGLGWAIKK